MKTPQQIADAFVRAHGRVASTQGIKVTIHACISIGRVDVPVSEDRMDLLAMDLRKEIVLLVKRIREDK